MTWNKPRKVWQWLLLFAPAVAAIVASETAGRWTTPIPPLHLANGAVVADVGGRITRLLSISLGVITASSVVIAIVLSHGPALAQRIVNGIFFLLCLMLTNGIVAFAGCALIGTPNSGRYEIVPAPANTGDGNYSPGVRAVPLDKSPPVAR
jgi:hypothetical protein